MPEKKPIDSNETPTDRDTFKECRIEIIQRATASAALGV